MLTARHQLLRRFGHTLLWGLLTAAFVGLTFSELSKRVDEASETPRAMRNRIVMESGRWVEAMPNSFRAHFYAGLAMERHGNQVAARRHYKRALEILPSYTAALTRLESIAESKVLPVTAPHADATPN